MAHPPPPVNPLKSDMETPPNNGMTPENTRKPLFEQFSSGSGSIQVQNNTKKPGKARQTTKQTQNSSP